MKVHYIACAQSSSLDAKTNQLSLFHLLDEIGAAAFPLVLPSICVAALFEREAEDAPVQSFVLAVTLEGKLVASFSLSADFTRARRTRTVNTVQGLSLPGPGIATISLLQKTRVLATWQAVVVQEKRAQPSAPAKPANEVEPLAATGKQPAAVH